MPTQRSYYQQLQSSEREISKKTKLEFKNEISNYWQCLALLDKTITDILDGTESHKYDLNAVDLAFITMGTRIEETSKVFMDISMKGYYHDSLIILRGIYENFYFLTFLSLNEGEIAKETAEKWTKTGKIETNHIKQKLGVFSDLKFQKSNSLFNDYVHSNFNAIANSMLTLEGNDLRLRRLPVFSKEFYQETFDPLIQLATVVFLILHFNKYIDSKLLQDLLNTLSILNHKHKQPNNEIFRAISAIKNLK